MSFKNSLKTVEKNLIKNILKPIPLHSYIFQLVFPLFLNNKNPIILTKNKGCPLFKGL